MVRHVLPFSGVWRLSATRGESAIYKEARAPLDTEHVVLRYAPSGLPVPQVLTAVQRGGRLGVIMRDLGEPDREATDADAAQIPDPERG